MTSRLAIVALLVISPTALLAQSGKTNGATQTGQKPAASPANDPAPNIDSAKEADIRRLLDLVGTRDLAMQSVESMTKSIKPLLTTSLPPGEYRDKLVELFFAKFSSKIDGQHILDMAVPIYDKNFSHDEIRKLIEFYQTPLGQKTTSVLPKLATEMREEGRKWGEALGRESMMQVLSEHPELAEALEAAQNNAASAPK